MTIRIAVQTGDIDAGAEIAALEALGGGAVASFTGVVRADRPDMTALELETYQAMAEAALQQIAEEATQRWQLLGVTALHRHGLLPISSRIVFIGVVSRRRHAALAATNFLIDWTKTKAPFWKREWTAAGAGEWVEARATDDAAAAAWDVNRQ